MASHFNASACNIGADCHEHLKKVLAKLTHFDRPLRPISLIPIAMGSVAV